MDLNPSLENGHEKSRDWALNCNDSSEEASYRVFQMQNPLILEKCPQGTGREQGRKQLLKKLQAALKMMNLLDSYMASKQQKNLVMSFVTFSHSSPSFSLVWGIPFSLFCERVYFCTDCPLQLGCCPTFLLPFLVCWSRLAHTMSREPLKDAAAAPQHPPFVIALLLPPQRATP